MIIRVAGEVPGGVMRGGTWARGWENVSTSKNFLWHKKDHGLIIISGAMKVMTEETTLTDLNAIKGCLGVLWGFERCTA